MALIR